MNISILIIEAIIFALIFTVIVLINYGGDKKYTAGSIHNYPPDIQEEYFKTHERIEVGYRSKKVILTKSLGLLVFIISRGERNEKIYKNSNDINNVNDFWYN